MHCRDWCVVQVKQCCDSVNTFLSICFHASWKLALMLFFFFCFNFLVSRFKVRDDRPVSIWPPSQMLLNLPCFEQECTLKKGKHFWMTVLEHRAFLHIGRFVNCESACGGCCVVKARRGLCSLCGQAALMPCFSYLKPSKVNEVVALLEGSRNGMSSTD